MRESTFKRHLIEQASIQRKSSVLDVGCGTAILLILVKQSHQEAEVVGLDGDQKILQIAKSKVEKATLDIALHNGIASALPYHEASFNRVTSSLVLHHLSREQKTQALREALRVLKLNGELIIADFGKPQNFLMSLMSFIVGRLEETSHSLKGSVPKIIREAGFEEVEETGKYMTTYGTLCLYKARKPENIHPVMDIKG